jgi:alkanesulfonate monooxygenase SsuD/methylene tetrahydromethanopterin reductase-like flavin-dependent oxidoreductase (luciferase family)
MSILIARNECELAAKKERYGDRFTLMGTPDAIVDGLQRYARAGSQYVTFNMPDAHDIEPILLFGETVVQQVAGLR